MENRWEGEITKRHEVLVWRLTELRNIRANLERKY
jgi:hypothetical protein